ncbi:MAG: pyrimidine/purine nucleoside phosphorylase [Polyangiales bacterium]
MTTQQAITFSGAEVTAKANVYFDGKVVSHAITLADGTRKTLGLIFPGSFHFATSAPERMQIIAGSCRARLDGTNEWKQYDAGSEFHVPGASGFDIAVEAGIAEYICSFEPDAP